jgi:hypothetical protein
MLNVLMQISLGSSLEEIACRREDILIYKSSHFDQTSI